MTQRGTLEKDLTAILTGRLYKNRMKLTPYSQALLALSLQQHRPDRSKARMLVDNLENTALIDRENGTANWTGARRWWWHWWDSPVETNAAVLRATLAVDPEERADPDDGEVDGEQPPRQALGLDQGDGAGRAGAGRVHAGHEGTRPRLHHHRGPGRQGAAHLPRQPGQRAATSTTASSWATTSSRTARRP